MLRVADDQVFDMRAFLRGEIAYRAETRCTLLCPIRGEALALTSAEIALLAQVPADRWVVQAEIPCLEAVWTNLVGLAKRGLVLADPPFDAWSDLSAAEETLQRTHWLDVAAVFHAHTRWQGMTDPIAEDRSDEAHVARLERVRKQRGDPPPHFVRRDDAIERRALKVPALQGAFFDALLARRTTRAFRSEEPLPLAQLELVLYAVFGAHGLKEFVPGISAIRRTSPSGGALHPVEAYLVALNVEGLEPGLYHYETGAHVLALLEPLDSAAARQCVCDFTAGQTFFSDSHVVVIHVARFDRSQWKYAEHRKAYKLVLMDSAHLSQTFYLTAAHVGLGAFYTAAINDADIGMRLRLDPMRAAAIGINGLGIAEAGRDDMHFIAEPYRPTGLA